MPALLISQILTIRFREMQSPLCLSDNKIGKHPLKKAKTYRNPGQTKINQPDQCDMPTS